MPPNTDHTHNKHNWVIIYNFNQVQVITSWWWFLCDPKHVGVYFNVCLLDFYITYILTSKAVIIECISWLIKVNVKIIFVQFFFHTWYSSDTSLMGFDVWEERSAAMFNLYTWRLKENDNARFRVWIFELPRRKIFNCILFVRVWNSVCGEKNEKM